MSKAKAESLGVKPIARLISYADAEKEPEWFTTAPADAVNRLLKKTGENISGIDYFEINEAFSVVSIANNRLLNLPADRVNIHGGAVALGHPLGCSGARILVTLIHILKQKNAKRGIAAICNGGGGASAVMIENV